MNPIDENVLGNDPLGKDPLHGDARFDRLVDGELNESERRELLAGLDNKPDGWRRCALAFLEAQCWRDELGCMVREPAPIAPAPRRLSSRRRRLGVLAAMAASFLVALVLGSQLPRLWPNRPIAPMPPIQVAEEDDKVENPVEPTVQPTDTPSTPWQMVTLDPIDGSGEPVRLPAVERETVDPDWLQGRPTAMPEDVLQALQQSGHRIRQHRRWLPLRMNDGRQLIVPVEQVDVQYVGRPTL